MLLNASLIGLFLVDQLYNTHNHGAQNFLCGEYKSQICYKIELIVLVNEVQCLMKSK